MVLRKPEQQATEPEPKQPVNLAEDEKAMRITAQHASDYSDLWMQAYATAEHRLRSRMPELRKGDLMRVEPPDFPAAAARIADAVLDEWRMVQRTHLEHRSMEQALSKMRRVNLGE